MSIQIIQHDWSKPLTVHDAKLVFADPPYNQGVGYEDDPTHDRMKDHDFQIATATWIQNIQWTVAPGGTLWWMCPERHGDYVGTCLTQLGWPRVHRIVWHETFAQYQQKQLTDDYRFIFCHMRPVVNDVEKWGKDCLTFNPDAIREPSRRQELGDARADPRGRVPGRVWNVRRLQGTSRDRVDWHPTQLAPELLTRIVRGWSNPGDLVVDAFAGSGNMGIVCHQEKRDVVLIDRSKTYCEQMEKRLRERYPCEVEIQRG